LNWNSLILISFAFFPFPYGSKPSDPSWRCPKNTKMSVFRNVKIFSSSQIQFCSNPIMHDELWGFIMESPGFPDFKVVSLVWASGESFTIEIFLIFFSILEKTMKLFSGHRISEEFRGIMRVLYDKFLLNLDVMVKSPIC
jgi:hypothetical protein